MKFAFILFLVPVCVFATQEPFSFFGPGQISSEEVFLKEREKRLAKSKMNIEYYQNTCKNSEDIKCQREIELSKIRYENSFKRRHHASVLVRERLNTKLGECVENMKSEELYPCFRAEFDYLQRNLKCAENGSYASKEYKSCFKKSEDELKAVYSKSKKCEEKNYLLVKKNIHYVGGSNPHFGTYLKDEKLPESHNAFNKNFKKCINEQYYEAMKFTFNPTQSDFLVGSKKNKYISLLDEYLEKEAYTNGEEKTIVTFRLSHSLGGHFGNFKFYNSAAGYSKLLFSDPLTGSEAFIKDMVKNTQNKYKSEVETAKAQLGRRVPLSHPDQATIIKQEVPKSQISDMKYEYHLGVNGEFVRGWAQIKQRFSDSFIEYIPELDRNGAAIWQDKNKGLLKWAKLDEKLLDKLNAFVKEMRREPGIKISIKDLKGEESLVFTVHHGIEKMAKSNKVHGNGKYKNGQVLAEYKAIKKQVDGKAIYALESEYEGLATRGQNYRETRSKEKISGILKILQRTDISENRRKSLEKELESLKSRLIDESSIPTIVNNDSSEQEVINNSETKIESTATEQELVNIIKEKDSFTQPVEPKETEVIKHQGEKEISRVSVIDQNYSSLINDCESIDGNNSLKEIYNKRTNSFLGMVKNLDSINCSNVEGKGCHSEEARKLIMKHYYLEKEAHQQAYRWSDESGNVNASKCLQLYGFMK